MDAAGTRVSKAQGASYYMLNWQNSKPSANPTLSDNRWENNTLMSGSGVMTLDSFGKLLTQALMKVLGSTDDFVFLPGFVSTRKAAHQELHVDSPVAFQVKKGNGSYILHMPLSVEGLTLRIGNLDDQVASQLEKPLAGYQRSGTTPSSIHVHDFFYHVPFGQALLLPEAQWHAGHYGKEDNLRFHAVLKRGIIETASLLLLGPVLENNYPGSTVEYTLDLSKNDPVSVVDSSTTKRHKQHTTCYIKKLTERMPGKLFLNCLPGIKNK